MENIENNNYSEQEPVSPASELLEMAMADQEMRKSWRETKKWDESIDARNTERLKEIIAAIGWPTKSKVGKDASTAAWLLAQHADHNPEFQQVCLDLMKQELTDEVSQGHIAYLEDRVRVNTGRPTLYGTQFYTNPEGQFGPRPIEDIESLDERRALMGLERFEEYEQRMKSK